MYYRIHQNNNSKVGKQGKFYARAVTLETVGTDKLAVIMQRNCTVKCSDIKAVIQELVETMTDQLAAGYRVKLDGFGSFKLTLVTKPADKAIDFNVKNNIKGIRCQFTPEAKTDRAGTRSKTFISGVTVQELPENKIEKEVEP